MRGVLLARKRKPLINSRLIKGLSILNGGEGGIWTHEGLLTLAGFQDQCIQPLCHLSKPLKRCCFGLKRPHLNERAILTETLQIDNDFYQK